MNVNTAKMHSFCGCLRRGLQRCIQTDSNLNACQGNNIAAVNGTYLKQHPCLRCLQTAWPCGGVSAAIFPALGLGHRCTMACPPTLSLSSQTRPASVGQLS